MAKGWLNLETATSTLPETQFFEGDSAFKFLGLSRTTRLYGFIGWWVCVVFVLSHPFWASQFGGWFCAQSARVDIAVYRAAGYICGCVSLLVASILDPKMCCTVLYVMGTIVSLVGTGFLIGVRGVGFLLYHGSNSGFCSFSSNLNL